MAFIDFNGSVSVSVGTLSSGSITATTPAHAAGKVDVVVMNPDFQTGTLAQGFTYSVVLPPPTVTGVSPTFGPVAGGTVVTISGTNFVSGATVAFGASSVPSTFVSSTVLRATAPAAGGPGTVSVAVTNPDTQSGSLPSAYTYSDTVAFYTVTPCRLIDTRNAAGPYSGPSLATGGTRSFVLAGPGSPCGIPAGA